jgi:hypothetical protein
VEIVSEEDGFGSLHCGVGIGRRAWTLRVDV